jgi:lipid-binding SYLF domain-containing protein
MTNRQQDLQSSASSRSVTWRRAVLAVCGGIGLGLVCLSPVRAGDVREQQQLVDRAKLTFDLFQSDAKLASWFRTEAKDMKAIFIVPQLLRGAFVVGASGGSGVLLARDFVKGGWSPPAFYRMSAGSVGFQAGADASEVVLVINTFAGLERFYGGGTFKLGLESGVSVGSIGEGGTAGLDVVSFASSKGAFLGMSFSGFAISASSDANEAYYGASVTPEQILANGPITNSGADDLRAAVSRANRYRERSAE